MSRVLVTGGAGFIGIHLAKSLLECGNDVIIVDNLSNSVNDFVNVMARQRNCRFVKGDIRDLDSVLADVSKVDVVFHLAANSDIARGACDTHLDLEGGTIGTYHVLEAMRRRKIEDLVFASSSAVYGEAQRRPTREHDGPLLPISLYGASKLACEGLISAFVHNYGMRAWIYRLGNVVGRSATHGVIVDFIRKLKRNPRQLEILGDGDQAKPYLHVSDCIWGMLVAYERSKQPVNYFNLTSRGVTTTGCVADIVVNALGLRDVEYLYTGGDRGWPGDVARVSLEPSKLGRLGWAARLTSDEAVNSAARELAEEMP